MERYIKGVEKFEMERLARIPQLPSWCTSTVDRITFHASRQADGTGCNPSSRPILIDYGSDLEITVAALYQRFATPGNEAPLLRDFLGACLVQLMRVAAIKPELNDIQPDLAALCTVARTALVTDLDDREVLRRAGNLVDLPGQAGFAARVPGRVVWLAAMAASVPEEAAAAAAMLADDLAAVDPSLPLAALRDAIGR